jgi:hypothetical protein
MQSAENNRPVVAQFDKEASQTRDYRGAKNAPHRAARPDSSLRKGRLLGMTIKLSHYQSSDALDAASRLHLGDDDSGNGAFAGTAAHPRDAWAENCA